MMSGKARFLKLRKRPSCLGSLVLARVTNHQDTVISMKLADELIHLCGNERRFVQHDSRCSPVSGRRPLARCICRAHVSIPASASFWAAREVGANPSTRYPSVQRTFSHDGQGRGRRLPACMQSIIPRSI